MASPPSRRRPASSRILSLPRNSSRPATRRPHCCRRWPEPAEMEPKETVLVIDNYDSFTYNLVQYLGELGERVVVRRNDEITLPEITELDPLAVVLSPGPGTPAEAGICKALLIELGPTLPVMGV